MLYAASLVLTALVQSVSAVSAWMPPAEQTAKQAPLYVTIENPTMYDVYIVKAKTDVAENVEFHESDGFGGDEPVKDFTIPAYESLEILSRGPHIVLTGLKRPLKEGQTVTITLTTDGGQDIEIKAEVRKP
ncbi:MAG: copper chaperone PCu(A)C [Vicinamibacterales bacterium]